MVPGWSTESRWWCWWIWMIIFLTKLETVFIIQVRGQSFLMTGAGAAGGGGGNCVFMLFPVPEGHEWKAHGLKHHQILGFFVKSH
eukprot:1330060-Amphidinium_carterae.1